MGGVTFLVMVVMVGGRQVPGTEPPIQLVYPQASTSTGEDGGEGEAKEVATFTYFPVDASVLSNIVGSVQEVINNLLGEEEDTMAQAIEDKVATVFPLLDIEVGVDDQEKDGVGVNMNITEAEDNEHQSVESPTGVDGSKTAWIDKMTDSLRTKSKKNEHVQDDIINIVLSNSIEDKMLKLVNTSMKVIDGTLSSVATWDDLVSNDEIKNKTREVKTSVEVDIRDLVNIKGFVPKSDGVITWEDLINQENDLQTTQEMDTKEENKDRQNRGEVPIAPDEKQVVDELWAVTLDQFGGGGNAVVDGGDLWDFGGGDKTLGEGEGLWDETISKNQELSQTKNQE